MFQQPDRSARTGLDGFTRIVLAVVAMTLVALAGAVVLAAVVVVTTQPLAVAAGGLVAVLLVGWAGGTLARWLRP